MKIKINNKEYDVLVADTEEERRKGLSGVEELPQNGGMIFLYDESQDVSYNMRDTYIPLDICFINKDKEVISVSHAEANSKQIYSLINVYYVLEVNINSGIQKGDKLLFDDKDTPVMNVLALDGSTQMELYGGERIFRREFTKQLVDLAKKAYECRDDEKAYRSYCERIGKKMFSEIDAQNGRKPEYVTIK